MRKIVAVLSQGEVGVHFPHFNGNSYTLCGLDGDDPNPLVDQIIVDVPVGAKVDCQTCIQIFEFVSGLSHQDIKSRKSK